jgi:dienelactone hydrolase
MCHSEVPEGQPEMVVAWDKVGIPVGGVDMPALMTPGADGLPAVLVIADMFGPTPFYEHLSALLTAAGFRTLLPDYHFREGPVDEGDLQGAFARRRRLDENRTLEDMRRAISWLRGTDGDSKVGVLGFCMGGTFALDLASTQRDLAVVSYYGFPAPFAGLELPPPPPIDLVDTLSGPVLAFWGEEDAIVGMDNVIAYTQRATQVNPHFSYEVLPGQGHGFLAEADLSDPHEAAGGTWDRTVRHLKSHLGNLN